VLASRWYRAEVVHALLDILARGKTDLDLQKLATEASASIMQKTISGIYKSIFALVVTPDRYVKHIDKVWQLHYDNGLPVIEPIGPKSHRVTYHDWRSHHPLICRLNMAAGTPIYEAMGCKDVVSRRVGCVSDGAPRCENIMTWR
jgi:hypothetical protein